MASVFDAAKTISIFQIYERYVRPLDRHRRNGNVSCFYHEDSKPSMHLYDKTNSYYCFSCKKSGDGITLVADVLGLSNPFDAAKQICDDFGLSYTVTELDPMYKQYIDVYSLVARLYTKCLKSPSCPNSNYFTERGFSEQLQEDYMLGYCPEYFMDTEGKIISLKDFLLKAFPSIEPTLLDAYGLYDTYGTSKFAGRYIFTIKDTKGNPIAFSGRSLDPDKAKYINTSDTPYFHKNNILYNFDVARKYSGSTIVVEGYCDALALISKGVLNVVASMGTSFTPNHIALLKGKDIVLALDNDAAGHKQMYSIITKNRNCKFYVWLWKGAKDFNELLLSNPSHMEWLITNKRLVTGPEFVIKFLKVNLDLSVLHNRELLWTELSKLIGANSSHYHNMYPVNTIYTPVALDYYWTILKRILKGKREI